ncbi:hypothetical protein BJY24_007033 [Nocardia transvalensis]|uniref:Uncharacterized protein n=1 Tax=Nocardia transvalensis TaxID=37333 RepID=A0A7W9UM04_9NOCA|nr:DMT family transporter [Nocardia transvalensis]MBB5918121.1 hypothetical protein [Nocardia transvalensis]
MITLGPWAVSGLLALLAALLFAFSASLQQGSVRSAALAAGEAPGVPAVIRVARSMLTSRGWLLGQGLSVAGFLCHAAALRCGAISTVQALLVVQLPFALPLAARRTGRRLLRRDWAGTAVICAGLVLLVAQGVPHGAVRTDRLPLGLGAVAITVPSLLLAARVVRSTQLRSALVAVSAGCCFATTAVLVTVATPVLPQLSWAWLGVPVSAVVGGTLVQEAFARGSLPTALTTTTVTDPVLSYIAGLTLFATATQPDFLWLIAPAALVVGGIALLANSPTLHDERQPQAPIALSASV